MKVGLSLFVLVVFARSLPEAREAPLRQSIATITPQSANRDVIAVILVHVQVSGLVIEEMMIDRKEVQLVGRSLTPAARRNI